ncbi:MAG: hypothetical protein CM1200mP32_10790 [Methanobacteriota archaeon]|nr:MAG: hypothetical protein CM1200mP32_10790 [Euryarchaeota archaeon]
MEPCASVESVKSVSEVYAPVGGEVIESNTPLEDSPERINEDPYGDGWISGSGPPMAPMPRVCWTPLRTQP